MALTTDFRIKSNTHLELLGKSEISYFMLVGTEKLMFYLFRYLKIRVRGD